MTFKKKRKVYISNVYFILQSAVGLGWENGRVGRESLFAIGTGGNLREKTKQKQTAKKKTKKAKQNSTPTINVPLFAFVVTLMQITLSKLN